MAAPASTKASDHVSLLAFCQLFPVHLLFPPGISRFLVPLSPYRAGNPGCLLPEPPEHTHIMVEQGPPKLCSEVLPTAIHHRTSWSFPPILRLDSPPHINPALSPNPQPNGLGGLSMNLIMSRRYFKSLKTLEPNLGLVRAEGHTQAHASCTGEQHPALRQAQCQDTSQTNTPEQLGHSLGEKCQESKSGSLLDWRGRQGEAEVTQKPELARPGCGGVSSWPPFLGSGLQGGSRDWPWNWLCRMKVGPGPWHRAQVGGPHLLHQPI